MKLLKKRVLKPLFFSLLLGLSSIVTWANSEIPSVGETIEPPPASPIDNYVTVALFLGVLISGYYFYKFKKTYLNDEK